jgi:uncharacterized protein YcfJ
VAVHEQQEITMIPRTRHPFRSTLVATALACAAGVALADITFYADDGFQGRTLASQNRIGNLARQGFNDSASSVIVTRNRWELCEDAGFSGRCVVLRPGQYGSLRAMGLNDRVSSARMLRDDVWVSEDRYGPPPMAAADYRRRRGERLFEAPVTAVRAVMGEPEQRCWIEQERVPDRSGAVGGGLAGAVIGGILGHQIGGGSGRDLATVGGAVGGAVVGSRIGGRHERVQDVQRCTTVTQSRPAYYDVAYNFRGQEHHVQLTSPPGSTITVNRNGEPRGG